MLTMMSLRCSECPSNCLECHMYNGQLRCMGDGCVTGYYYNSGTCTGTHIAAIIAFEKLTKYQNQHCRVKAIINNNKK